jgi:hypothetical protein
MEKRFFSRVGIMRPLALALLLTAAGCTCENATTTAAASVSGQEKAEPLPIPLEKKAEPLPIPLDKWGFEYAVKTWALKVKSASYNNNKYTFVVEFTKDLKPEELTSLKEAFPPSNSREGSKLACYFFDKDNVIVDKRSDFRTTTELTGMKGDAFRLEIYGPSSSGANVVRAELRAKKSPPLKR